jgi:LPXTG-site transpeptidase (sortase) family protein
MNLKSSSPVTITSDGTIHLQQVDDQSEKIVQTDSASITAEHKHRYKQLPSRLLTFIASPFVLLWRTITNTIRRCLAMLQKPIDFKRNKPKRTLSRLELFLRDVVSFGFTFVVLFSFIFAALNYQSILQIIKSHTVPAYEAYEPEFTPVVFNNTFINKPTVGDTLSFLPAVGPPDNWIFIPSLQLKAPISIPSSAALLNQDWQRLEADIQTALESGVAHYPGTAAPGQAGNFFVTGHSSYYPWAEGDFKSIFALLPQLNVQDEYFIYYNGNKHRYRITDKKEVQPTDVSVLDQPVHKRASTLMTCTPIGTTLRRLILNAEELDVITGEALAVGEQSQRALPTIGVSQLSI